MNYQKVLLLAVLLGGTAIFVYLTSLLAQPFLPGLTAALSLAILTTPLFDWYANRLRKNQTLAAAATVITVTLLVLVPLWLIGNKLVTEAQSAAEQVSKVDWSSIPLLKYLGANFDPQQEIGRVLESAQQWAATVLAGTVYIVTQLAITVFALFFLLRDREGAIEVARSLTPLNGTETDEVFERVRDMVRATVYGNLSVAGIQGLLGGLMFWILGLQAPVLWGLLMMIMAMIPSMGTFLVWAPTAVYLILNGSWGKGVFLAIWGAGVVSMIDNVVYPFLVGKDIRIHTLPVFLALLGGIAVYGAVGIVLGPIILAVTIKLLQIVKNRMIHPEETLTGPTLPVENPASEVEKNSPAHA